MNKSTERRLAYGSNAAFVTVIVVAALVVLYALADATRIQWDVSAGAGNTLDADTLAKLRLLDEMGEPVKITAFTSQRGKAESYFKDRSIGDLLRLLDEGSTRVQWDLVDFDKERLTAEELGVTDYGHVVLQRGTDRVDIKDRELFHRVPGSKTGEMEFTGEAAVSRGLSQLLTPQRRVVYVTTGHGELAAEDPGPDGLSSWAEALDRERFDVEPLDLLRTDESGRLPDVPQDAAAVFVARPRTPLSPEEEDLLLSYVGRGGPVLLAVDVGTPVPALVDRLGAAVPEGVGLDTRYLAPHRDRPVVWTKGHPITDEIDQAHLVTVIAHGAGITLAATAPEGVRANPVIVSGRDGWIDRGGAMVDGGAVYEPEIDLPGPVNFMVAFELLPGKGLVRASKGIGRVLLCGDADVFTNAMWEEGPGNAVLAVNAFHWLAGSDERLKVGGGHASKVRRLAVTDEQLSTLRWLSLGVMPLVVLAFGIAMWASRRGR